MESYSKQSLRKALEKLSKHRVRLNGLIELQFILPMIYEDSPPPFGQRIQAISAEHEFEDMAEIQSFVEGYNNYYNLIIQMLSIAEDKEPPDDEELLLEAVYLFQDFYKNSFEDSARNMAVYLIERIMKVNNADFNNTGEISNETRERLKRRLSEAGLINLENLMEQVKAHDPSEVLLTQILILALYLNIKRKQRLIVREKMGNGGRNMPCPCDSGLKYKNCCLL